LLAGWSPDSARLYFAAPFTGGSAWKVYTYDLETGETRESFTIENGTPKALDPRLSPDEKWIAYRGPDNSSLYLVHTDGSDMHLVLDNAGVSGLAWASPDWLGVSVSGMVPEDNHILVINPNTCQAYRIPALTGSLNGLWLP
ncbi:MAG: hypothetical protein GYA17_15260, partial [Chloroflexi bacterium]|nr:hypothetical protein [Chloroflexota bacterium]